MINPITAIGEYLHRKPRKITQCHIFQIGGMYQVRYFQEGVGLSIVDTLYRTKEEAQRQVDRMTK